MKRLAPLAAAAIAALLLSPGQPAEARPGAAAEPPADCRAEIGYDRFTSLSGYKLPTALGPKTCIPFTTVAAHPPAGYRGDFYVDQYTDAKLRARWHECKQDPECYQRVERQILARKPPNREYGMTDPRQLYLLGKVPGPEPIDLRQVRRPGFFARAPYREPIAALDNRASVVEFTAPADTYDRLHAGHTGDIKLRGWYIRGDGVADRRGHRKRALVIWVGGGGDRIAAIDDPSDHLYHIDAAGKLVMDSFPNATTGASGPHAWRAVWTALNAAGFDVLALDRRGIGLSGGFTDTNTLQQGRDLLKIVADLRSGAGMRALSPDGRLLAGADAAAMLRGGPPAGGLPVLLLGSSRGTMSSGWAMTINFDRDCAYDAANVTCGPARRDPAIKGAMLVAEFSSGVGYVPADMTAEDNSRGLGKDRGLFIAGTEEELNIVFFPSSAILAGVSKWPSAFFARGLWCYADGLEGTVDSYSRVRGPKELVVVRGPHPFETWPEEEQQRVTGRMIAYARTVVLGGREVQGGRPWSNMRELVATAGDVWEASSRPGAVARR
jgi:hypothetical protein